MEDSCSHHYYHHHDHPCRHQSYRISLVGRQDGSLCSSFQGAGVEFAEVFMVFSRLIRGLSGFHVCFHFHYSLARAA